MNNTISLQKDQLFILVKKFIENCYSLVENMCNIVGYYDED